jgi:hypothetical protein
VTVGEITYALQPHLNTSDTWRAEVMLRSAYMFTATVCVELLSHLNTSGTWRAEVTLRSAYMFTATVCVDLLSHIIKLHQALRLCSIKMDSVQ